MTTAGTAAPTGAAPGLREPLAVEFANTLFAVRGRLRDGIATTDELTIWLRERAASLDVDAPLGGSLTDAQVQDFVALRNAIRGLLRSAAEAEEVGEVDLARLNEAAAAAPVWPRLDFGEHGFTTRVETDRPPVSAALAALARSAVALLSGPTREDLRACHAPGCVLFFVKDHPRREWCCAACGNRARAARHYQRHREG
jgi:predicted RNA-binding Zn ribbon-like protein